MVIKFPCCAQGEESSTDGRTLQRPKYWIGAGILIKCVESKCLAHRSEFQIRTTVEIHKGFLNHRLHLAVTTLHVHHHCDRYAACNPVFALCCEVAHGAHVAGKATELISIAALKPRA